MVCGDFDCTASRNLNQNAGIWAGIRTHHLNIRKGRRHLASESTSRLRGLGKHASLNHALDFTGFQIRLPTPSTKRRRSTCPRETSFHETRVNEGLSTERVSIESCPRNTYRPIDTDPPSRRLQTCLTTSQFCFNQKVRSGKIMAHSSPLFNKTAALEATFHSGREPAYETALACGESESKMQQPHFGMKIVYNDTKYRVLKK